MRKLIVTKTEKILTKEEKFDCWAEFVSFVTSKRNFAHREKMNWKNFKIC